MTTFQVPLFSENGYVAFWNENPRPLKKRRQREPKTELANTDAKVQTFLLTWFY